MARGGYREKAGRKSSWVSGCSIEETKLIRVPARIADQVLKAAHDIDAGCILEKVNLINNEDLVIKAKQVLIELKGIDKGRKVAAARLGISMLLGIDENLLR